MKTIDRQTLYSDLVETLRETRDDWTGSTEVTESTGLFNDLGFESIDAVALGTFLEERYDRSLPFADFLTKAKEEGLKDITVGHLLDFLTVNLNGSGERKTP